MVYCAKKKLLYFFRKILMQDKQVSISNKHVNTSKQRLDCGICNYRVEPNDESAFYTFHCNVRAFRDEKFKVWKCPGCKTIHCLDVVNLDHYYAQYPYAKAKLTWPYRFIYGNICRRLTKHGFSKTHSLLDYGCGVNGLFVQYLQQRGFTNAYGYDPYAPEDGFGDPTTLQRGPFDYILLQDVIEHVEDPNALLDKLNSLLSPGGYILIGEPNAANINLNLSDVPDSYNEVHVPYHLHIYTPESLEFLGSRQGWEPVDFFDRRYDDTRWLGLNARTVNTYVSLRDGSMDVIFEPLELGKALISYKFFFYAIFGYWLSFRTAMAIMFRKSIGLT
jgi:2-polyprenyl-3-methyl-5-hydroxy-6-metoxy-1,4-benzoquinol methylase